MSLIRQEWGGLLRRAQNPRVGTRPDLSASPATETRIAPDPETPDEGSLGLTPLSLAPGYMAAADEAVPALYVERGRVWLAGVVTPPADAADGDLVAALPGAAAPTWNVGLVLPMPPFVDGAGNLYLQPELTRLLITTTGALKLRGTPVGPLHLEGLSYGLAQLPPGTSGAYGNYPYAEDYPHAGDYPYRSYEPHSYPYAEDYPNSGSYPH